MTIESGKPYRIMNQRAGLAAYVSTDEKSILGEYVEPVDRQTWIPETVPRVVGGAMHIKSLENGKYMGFEGNAGVGVKVIVGDRSIAKLWDIKVDPSDPDYKIVLHGTQYMVEFPKSNLQPGTHAQLALDHSHEPDHLNQVWVFTKLT